MANRNNDWAVSYSSIAFFEKMLRSHGNVAALARSRDIMCEISRKKPQYIVRAIVVNTYVFGVADFYKARDEFPDGMCIVLSGNWNAYTWEAQELTVAEDPGLLMPREFVAAVWREEPHKYVPKDHTGNPVYNFRAA